MDRCTRSADGRTQHAARAMIYGRLAGSGGLGRKRSGSDPVTGQPVFKVAEPTADRQTSSRWAVRLTIKAFDGKTLLLEVPDDRAVVKVTGSRGNRDDVYWHRPISDACSFAERRWGNRSACRVNPQRFRARSFALVSFRAPRLLPRRLAKRPLTH